MSLHHCTVEKCTGQVVARGLCWKHYMRRKRWGDALVTKRAYRSAHLCRSCGATEPASFYKNYKSVCKACKKLRAAGR